MFHILVSDKLGDIGLERLSQADDTVYDIKLNLSKKDLLAIMPAWKRILT